MNQILKHEKAFLIIICIIALFSRGVFLNDRGFAGDEKYSLLVSQFLVQEGGNQPESLRNPASSYFTPQQFWAERSYTDFMESIARRENGSGALYFLTLHYWSHLFGMSDGTMRFPSLLFSVLLLPILFFFTKKHFSFSKKTPYFVAIAAIISPFYFNYALVARNYAMTFTLALLATFLFLDFLKSDKPFWRNSAFWLYSTVLIFLVFGHHSIVVLFPLHFLILLVSQKFNKFFPLGFAMILPCLGLLLWSLSEGGRYSFDAIQNSKMQYLQIAATGTDAMVQFSTPANIFRQFWAVLSYLYLPISGAALKIEGLKNSIICILSSGVFFVAISFLKDAKFRIALAVSALLLPLVVYSYSAFYFTIAAVGLSFIGVYLIEYAKNFRSLEWQTVTLMAIVPLAFLVVFALMDGITMRINARYAGFAYPFLLLIVVVAIEILWAKFNRPSSLLIYLGVIVGFIILPEWKGIIEDNSPRYFHFVKGNRLPNPYATLANKIVENYAEGDTVLYCSQPLPILPGTAASPDYSLLDAQYTNLYLPKNATFIQRGDTTESNKVVLWKYKSKQKVVLMDLSDKRY